MSIIKKVILTIAAAALFVVPVTIISLQTNTTKTAEASHYNNNGCANTDFAKLGYYCPPVNQNYSTSNYCYYSTATSSYSNCPTMSNAKSYTTYPNTNSNVSYVNSNYTAYSYPYNTTNYTTPSYNSCATGYTAYGCSDMNNYYNSNYSYSQDYSYYNQGNYNNYITEPYVDVYVPQPKYDLPALKNSDSQYTKNNYCQYKYNSSDYVFDNWYCVK